MTSIASAHFRGPCSLGLNGHLIHETTVQKDTMVALDGGRIRQCRNASSPHAAIRSALTPFLRKPLLDGELQGGGVEEIGIPQG